MKKCAWKYLLFRWSFHLNTEIFLKKNYVLFRAENKKTALYVNEVLSNDQYLLNLINTTLSKADRGAVLLPFVKLKLMEKQYYYEILWFSNSTKVLSLFLQILYLVVEYSKLQVQCYEKTVKHSSSLNSFFVEVARLKISNFHPAFQA